MSCGREGGGGGGGATEEEKEKEKEEEGGAGSQRSKTKTPHKDVGNYISYLDANNLYGLAMSMKLPIGELKWIKKLLNEKMIMDWNENDDFAYI